MDLVSDRPRSARIERIAFDQSAVEAIAATLGVAPELASFQLPGAAVYQLLVPGAAERPAAMVTLWPSLHRVDVIAGPATIVVTRIVAAELVPDVEVIFRRDNGECLIVARGGKVIART